jgi:hypothetical protein
LKKTPFLSEVVKVVSRKNLSIKMDEETFSVADCNEWWFCLQTMQNLPGVSVQDGRVQIRGNDKVTLIDGKQTALTGFGNQSGLDNIPASAIGKEVKSLTIHLQNTMPTETLEL